MSAAYSVAPPAANFESSREQYERIAAFLSAPEAMHLGHAALEEHLTREGRELQRRLLQEHLDLRSAAERTVAEVRGSDGGRRTEARSLGVNLGSLFGGVRSVRLVYQGAGVRGLAPMDAVLNRPSGYYSHGVRRLVAEHAAKDSFEEVIAEVEAITGCRVNKRQVEELAMAAAADFDAFYTRAPLELSVIGLRAHVVLSFDGKGIVVRREDLREATRKVLPRKARASSRNVWPGERSAIASAWPRSRRSMPSSRSCETPKTSFASCALRATSCSGDPSRRSSGYGRVWSRT